jgi:hypothetical protein
MIELTQAEAMGGQQWDAVVSGALTSSGIDGTMMLGGNARPVSIPFGLPALMGALLHFVAPAAPRRLRVYTYAVPGVGCLLEMRGARELASLPASMLTLAQNLGVQLTFSLLPGSCAVQLTLPPLAPTN